MLQVRVRLFGSVREAAGAKELLVTLPPEASVGELRALLAREHPAVGALGQRLRASVNLEIVDDARRLAEGDEVAFLPPVAGGSGLLPGAGGSGLLSPVTGGSGATPRCTLSDRPLDVAEVVARVAGPDTGGSVTFLGTVRREARGRSIRHLEYEAYPELAAREMERIRAEAEVRWPGTRVALAHRCGQLEIGEIAVVVVAAAPHRAEAFEAARWSIDALKESVPIWKKEIATDGEYWVDDRP